MAGWAHLLKSLWVLDRVLQTGSISQAAKLLNVSQSAVSQQIKILEEEFGPLFDRTHRTLLPTDLARRLQTPLRRGFAHIEEGVSTIRACSCEISISVLPSFASAWLIPHLSNFTQQHPEIEVKLTLANELVDFSSQNFDAAIRLTTQVEGDVIARELVDDEVFLACTPALRDKFTAEPHPRELASHHIILDDCPAAYSWEAWQSVARKVFPGMEDIRFKGQIQISDASQVIRSALGGQGVALVRRVLVADELATGQLVPLFSVQFPMPQKYFLVMPTRSRTHPAVRVFQEWLTAEIAPYRRKLADLLTD